MSDRYSIYLLRLDDNSCVVQTTGDKPLTIEEFGKILPRLFIGYRVVEYKPIGSLEWVKVR